MRFRVCYYLSSLLGLASAALGEKQITVIATLFPHLRKLCLADNSQLRDTEFKSLSLLTELGVLNIANTGVRESMRMNDVNCLLSKLFSLIGGLSSISLMSSLWELSLEACGNINLNSCKYFTALGSLQILDLYQVRVFSLMLLFMSDFCADEFGRAARGQAAEIHFHQHRKQNETFPLSSLLRKFMQLY